MSKLWVLVGDSSRAVLYSMTSRVAKLREIECFSQPTVRQHEQELTSDQPGRSRGGGGGAKHTLEPRLGKKAKAVDDFARYLCEIVDKGRLAGKYDKLVLCANPHFLGLIRLHLSDSTRLLVAAEVHKNLVRSPVEEVQHNIVNALLE